MREGNPWKPLTLTTTMPSDPSTTVSLPGAPVVGRGTNRPKSIQHPPTQPKEPGRHFNTRSPGWVEAPPQKPVWVPSTRTLASCTEDQRRVLEARYYHCRCRLMEDQEISDALDIRLEDLDDLKPKTVNKAFIEPDYARDLAEFRSRNPLGEDDLQ